MAIRTAHGNARGSGPRVEVLPVDELPWGVPAPAQQPEPEPAYERPKAFTPMQAGTERTRALARKGGLAKAAKERSKVRMLESMGLVGELPADVSLHPFLLASEQFALAEIERLAIEVGGGHCPINAASCVQSAALQLASSRWLTTYANGDEKRLALAGRLADSSRQNLLAAHELTARTAASRPKDGMNQTERALASILGANGGSK